MYNPVSILFYLRARGSKEGQSNIYLRITIDGKRAETSINRKVEIRLWNSTGNSVIGNSHEAYSLNRYLNKIKNDIYNHYQKLTENGEYVTAAQLRDVYLGKNKNEKMILRIFQAHNDQVEKLIGQDFAAGTAERYRTAKKHVGDYIRTVYKIEDIPVQNIDHKFISGFEFYLKSERKCSHNTSIKYITNFKKIIRIAFANDWIKKDPFLNWKARLKVADREFLNEDEIQRMYDKVFKIERLDQVRDIFLFCCFTGLAYADVKKLHTDDIVLDIKGERWIKTKRTKTHTRSSIPILPTAEVILEKYASHQELNDGKLLPVLSNQKMNSYLKEIGDVCGMKKNLTFHLARHTFATTVTLSNGVPIESVSKMLGHTSLRTTQHYAKILDRKVSEDMGILRQKLIDSNPGEVSSK